MPYTPPSHRSPASSKPSSPILTRNHSYNDKGGVLSPVHQPRPALPRSVSSTSYLNRHRRSPSISSHQGNGQAAVDAPVKHSSEMLDDQRPSSNGAITTPPDSSDDEDRGRNLENLRELQEALQHINVKREHSPERDGVQHPPVESKPQPTIVVPPRPALTPEARKISHSRSSSDIALSKLAPPLDTSPVISSTDGSDADEDDLRMKPPLLRKKSGELVKPALRPASRRRPSSMPGTPTFSKAVHFNEDIEQVRHFLQVDRPIAVSAGSSPVETYDSESEYPFEGRKSRGVEWEIKLANFPAESYQRKTMPVRVERIFLAADSKTLIGSVAVANLSFQKLVVARFTLDYWKTTSEVVAEYNQDVRRRQAHDGYDRFNFNIKLEDQANLESKTLLLCVRYNVNGQEYWDNNGSMNFQIDFVKKPRQRIRAVHHSTGVMGAIPRSRQKPPAPRPRSMPVGSFDDDFEHSFDNRFEFGSSGRIIGDSTNSTIRLKPKSKNRGNLFPDQALRNPTGQQFSTRYDFGASLSAALSTAQTALGDRSGIKAKNPTEPSVPTGPSTTRSAAPIPGTRPDAISSEKPDLQSAEYNELIQKFCFFGTPGKGSPRGTTPAATANSKTDGSTDYISPTGSGSLQSSVSSSPSSPPAKDLPSMVDGANDSRYSTSSPNHFLVRSNSPGRVTGSGPEDHLPSPFQYGYGNMQGGIFPERAHTPQACV